MNIYFISGTVYMYRANIIVSKYSFIYYVLPVIDAHTRQGG